MERRSLRVLDAPSRALLVAVVGPDVSIGDDGEAALVEAAYAVAENTDGLRKGVVISLGEEEFCVLEADGLLFIYGEEAGVGDIEMITHVLALIFTSLVETHTFTVFKAEELKGWVRKILDFPGTLSLGIRTGTVPVCEGSIDEEGTEVSKNPATAVVREGCFVFLPSSFTGLSISTLHAILMLCWTAGSPFNSVNIADSGAQLTFTFTNQSDDPETVFITLGNNEVSHAAQPKPFRPPKPLVSLPNSIVCLLIISRHNTLRKQATLLGNYISVSGCAHVLRTLPGLLPTILSVIGYNRNDLNEKSSKDKPTLVASQALSLEDLEKGQRERIVSCACGGKDRLRLGSELSIIALKREGDLYVFVLDDIPFYKAETETIPLAKTLSPTPLYKVSWK